MRDSRSLVRAKRRNRERVSEMAPLKTEAFKWAWQAIEGWGYEGKNWTWVQRIDKAQQLAFFAVNAPVWAPEPKKRWREIEA